MQIRWFQTYDEYGLNSEKTLQYWDSDMERWLDVPFIRCRISEEERYLTHRTHRWEEK